ncbi:hypothetical protein D9611_013320 [Ephemerocybe angulata]|uniref:Uncharacterized protein n=2 Tax=Ephemerocybe angulata TaxID=980116 RepID=A0A8H5FJ48_9AGAR|nr:hypothetical protein D9611_013320 [Tulosesus angulatus]KAF6763535.1 hypothetical protein DFP72DRAFT_1136095 [Tulosesus angulatus]
MSVVGRRSSVKRKPTRKLVRRPAQRRKLTKAEKDARKARNLLVRTNINQAIDEEHERLWERADALQDQYGLHSRRWWYNAIIQAPKKASRVLKMTRWRAFLSKSVRAINDERRANDEPTVKVPEVSAQLAAQWAQMSDEQKAELDPYIKEFEDQRQVATRKVSNVDIAAFHDVRAFAAKWQAEADDLHARTGVQMMFAIVRDDFNSFNKPFVFATSQQVENFFLSVYRTDLATLGLRLESFMLSGATGLALNYVQGISALKSEIARLIHSKLCDCVGRLVSKMCYTNFHERITVPLRVIVQGWPLKKFASPSDIGSKSDLELLRHAWTNDTAKFVKLDDAEYDELCAQMSKRPVAMDDDESEPEDQPDHASGPTSTPSAVAISAADAVQAPVAGSPSPSTPPAVATPIPAAPVPSAASAPAPPASSAQNFILTVQGANGQMVNVATKTRKPRSDKGVKRGPRKGKENATAPTASPAA